MPDFVTAQPHDGSPPVNVQVVQIWANSRSVTKDSRLRAYVERRGREGIAALIRLPGDAAILLIPPSMNTERQWVEIVSNMKVKAEHSFADVMQALGGDVQLTPE